MQVRSENQQNLCPAQISKPVKNEISTKVTHSRKRGSLVDLTNNNNNKRARKKNVSATKGCSKRHMTRSYFRKISTNETKKAKSDSKSKIKVANSRGGISVFNDSDAADVETVPADATIPVPATSLPEGVRNFDDDNDPIHAYCYAADLHKYYFERECKFRPSMEAIYEVQTDFTHQNRGMLLDWIIDVVQEFTLESETLFITVNLIDRTLSKILVLRGQLQLLGVACLNLAAKYAEDRGKSPLVEDLAEITDRAYTSQEILQMEKDVLDCLDFELSLPTAHAFLTRFLRCGPSGKQERALAQYISELSLMDLNMVKYKSSVIAAGALCLTRLLLRQQDGDTKNEDPLWDRNLEYHTKLTLPELHECVQDMHRHHSKMQHMKLRALYEKYSESRFAVKRNAAEIQPLTKLPFDKS